MRHAVIKFTNSTSVVLFGLLLVLLPRTTDPDLAPPVNVNIVSAQSDPTPVDSSTKKVIVDTKIHWLQGRRLMIVKWSDGKTLLLNPCKYEDGRNCYWEADRRGNKIGDSFVVAFGKIWYLNAYAL